MRLRPKKSWQFLNDSTAAFWWDTPIGRKGVAGSLNFCKNLDCSCTKVGFVGVDVDELDQSVKVGEGKMSILSNASRGERGRRNFTLDIESRGVEAGPSSNTTAEESATSVDEESQEVARRVEELLTEEFRDRLWERWAKTKQLDLAAPSFELCDDWQPGEWLAYVHVFQNTRQTFYEVDRRRFEVTDAYAIEDSRDVPDLVMVSFFEEVDGESVFDDLSYVLDLTESGVWTPADIVDVYPAPNIDSKLAKKLLQYFQYHYSDKTRLLERGKQLAEAMHATIVGRKLQDASTPRPRNEPRVESASTPTTATTLASPRRDSRKSVGRNDPCPCGSGKKHKKCCM